MTFRYCIDNKIILKTSPAWPTRALEVDVGLVAETNKPKFDIKDFFQFEKQDISECEIYTFFIENTKDA